MIKVPDEFTRRRVDEDQRMEVKLREFGNEPRLSFLYVSHVFRD
jgi:hypothetical protein